MRVPASVALGVALFAVFSSIVWGQKLESRSYDQIDVLRVETSPNHLTVVELGDPVTMVAVGDPGAFLIERRENKVLIKPYEEGASTNLFIWTPNRRYAYELVPAPDISRMHFAIDQPAAPRTVITPPPTPVPAAPVTAEGPLREMLSAAVPVSVYGKRERTDQPQVTIRFLYRHGDRVHLQYEVANYSDAAYSLAPPSVWLLSPVRSKQSLVPLGDVQLGEKFARSLSIQGTQPAKVFDADQAAIVGAGASGVGWVELELPKSQVPQVLQLQFPRVSLGPVTTFLVLNPREIGDAAAVE